MFPVQFKQVGELSAIQKEINKKHQKLVSKLKSDCFMLDSPIYTDIQDICCRRRKYVSLSADIGLNRPEHNAATGHYVSIEQSCLSLLSLYSLILSDLNS